MESGKKGEMYALLHFAIKARKVHETGRYRKFRIFADFGSERGYGCQ